MSARRAPQNSQRNNKARRPVKAKARSRRQRKGPPKNFWGEVVPLDPLAASVRPTPEPVAVAKSLGPAPVHGREQVAEHFFDAVYERAVGLASALAAAGGMLDEAKDEPDL